MKCQSKVRLGKNLVTLIIVVTIGVFFYVYKPSERVDFVLQNDTISKLDSAKVENLKDTMINPNTARYEEFLQVGFSQKQANSCINYRNKGGKFYKKTDLKKIYSISAEDYERLESHIFVEEFQKHKKTLSQKQETTTKKEKTSKKICVYINVCDSAELTKLPKIGGFRAKKIIERRERLGGFYSMNQLFSIYSFDSVLVEEFSQYIIIDTSQIRKININEATFKEINQHPLISYEQTKNILNYRKIVGVVKNVDELRLNNIVTNDEYEILKFYLKTF